MAEEMTLAGGVLLGAMGGAGAFFLTFCLWMTFFFLHPARVKRDTAARYWREVDGLPRPETALLETPDRLRLVVNWLPQPGEGPHPTLVLCHGVTSYKEEMIPLAQTVYQQGYNVCLFDFRGHGESDGRVSTIGMDEAVDVGTVMAWLKRKPTVDQARLGLLGHSMGAAAILNYLADVDDETPYAILLAPFATLERAVCNRLRRFRVPPMLARHFMGRIARQRIQRDLFENAPINVIGSIRECRLYFIHGTADRGNNPQDSQDLYDQSRVAKELYWVEHAGHHGLIYDARVWDLVSAIAQREAGVCESMPPLARTVRTGGAAALAVH